MNSYEEYRKHREAAAKHIAQGKYDEALKSIDEAIMSAPDSELLHIAAELRRSIAPKAVQKWWQVWRLAS